MGFYSKVILHKKKICIYKGGAANLLRSCLSVCYPMDHSPPESSFHGVLQVRILEWIAKPSSKKSSQPRDQPVFLMSPELQTGSLPLVPPGNLISPYTILIIFYFFFNG